MPAWLHTFEGIVALAVGVPSFLLGLIVLRMLFGKDGAMLGIFGLMVLVGCALGLVAAGGFAAIAIARGRGHELSGLRVALYGAIAFSWLRTMRLSRRDARQLRRAIAARDATRREEPGGPGGPGGPGA